MTAFNTITRNIADANVYANTARFDNSARALTEDEIFRNAPSVFAVDKHESRSERFRPIPTIEILRGLSKEGFSVVGATQATTRDASKRNYTKHLLRLRRIDGRQYSVGDTVHEILLRNANDGTAAYDLYSGLFRIRCLNSLVSNVGELDSVKVRHSGDVQHKVIEGTYRVLDTAEQALAAPQDWSQIQTSREERLLLAAAARVARFGTDENGNVDTAVRPQQLLIPRRPDDRADDLWTNFNVIQENAIRGGLTARRPDAQRFSTTREVKGIDQLVGVNKALWMITAHFASLKQAA